MSKGSGGDSAFGLIDRVQFTLFLDKERVCMRCQEVFTLRENLGTLKCPSFHPLMPTPDGRMYECCSRRVGADGCCGADHIDNVDIEHKPRSFEDANKTNLTFEQFRLLAIKREDCNLYVQGRTWHRSDKLAVWVVDRVDWLRYYEQRNLLGKRTVVPVRYEFDRWRPDEEPRLDMIKCARSD